jgi:hypothetical protein
MAVLVPLMQRRKEVGHGAKEEGGRWRALAGALRGRRPPEEGSGLDGKVGRLVGERLRAALAAEEPRGAEEAEGAMGRPGPLQVLRRGAATTHGTFIRGKYQPGDIIRAAGAAAGHPIRSRAAQGRCPMTIEQLSKSVINRAG